MPGIWTDCAIRRVGQAEPVRSMISVLRCSSAMRRASMTVAVAPRSPEGETEIATETLFSTMYRATAAMENSASSSPGSAVSSSEAGLPASSACSSSSSSGAMSASSDFAGARTSRTFNLAGTNETFSYHFYDANRPFSNFTRVIGFESTAESRYNGLTLELSRRMVNNFQLRASYTLGKVEDTVPDATAVVPGNPGDDVKYASDPNDFEADRTAGNNDQRHRLVLSGLYETTGLAQSFDGLARTLLEAALSLRPDSLKV